MAQDPSYPFAYSKYSNQSVESKVSSSAWLVDLLTAPVIRVAQIQTYKTFDTNAKSLEGKANATYARILSAIAII